MARRRKGNPLLTRILVVSVAAHVIALPILAHFGAFKKLEKQFGTAKVVLVNSPISEKEKPAQKTIKKVSKIPQNRSSAGPSKSTSTAARSNLNEVKVVASTGAGAESGGPTVDANASGKAGVVPTVKNPGGAGTSSGGPTPNNSEDSKVTEAKPKEPVKASLPVVPPLRPEAKPVPKFVAMEATSSPEPTIPDDLRGEPLEKTLIVEATVSESGVPSEVTISLSTGIKELDSIGLETAKKWRFKPATLDGQPVQGRVRFRIEFKVE